LRDQAEMYREGAEDAKELNKWTKLSGLFNNISSLAGLFGDLKMIPETTTETTTKGATTEAAKAKGADKPSEAKKIDLAEPEVSSNRVGIDIEDEKIVNQNMKEAAKTITKLEDSSKKVASLYGLKKKKGSA
jgi:hypothetical protein